MRHLGASITRSISITFNMRGMSICSSGLSFAGLTLQDISIVVVRAALECYKSSQGGDEFQATAKARRFSPVRLASVSAINPADAGALSDLGSRDRLHGSEWLELAQLSGGVCRADWRLRKAHWYLWIRRIRTRLWNPVCVRLNLARQALMTSGLNSSMPRAVPYSSIG